MCMWGGGGGGGTFTKHQFLQREKEKITCKIRSAHRVQTSLEDVIDK